MLRAVVVPSPNRPSPIRPPQGTFDIAASHTNASQLNELQVGLEFRNTTDKPVKLKLSMPLMSDLPVYARDPQQTVKADKAHGRQLLDRNELVKPPATARALPSGEVEITIPRNTSVQVQIGQVGKFPQDAGKSALDFNKNRPTPAQLAKLRGGTRSLYYEMQASMSPPGSLEIFDISRHVGGQRQNFLMEDGKTPVTPLFHHQGLFSAQRQTQSAPVLLTLGGQRATFQIKGDNAPPRRDLQREAHLLRGLPAGTDAQDRDLRRPGRTDAPPGWETGCWTSCSSPSRTR